MRGALRAVIGLFVDDGSLALALLAWIAVAAALHLLLPPSAWHAPLFALGIALVLVENVRRAGRRARR